MKGIGRTLAFIVSALLALVGLLALSAPRIVADVGLAGPTALILLHGGAALLLFTGFGCRSRAGTVLALATVLSLPALLLAGIWGTGTSRDAYIAGLVPFSDARGYLHCSRLVLEGATFDLPACSRRPLFTTFLAGLLAVAAQNLMLVNALLAAVTALSCFVSSLEVRRQYGVWSSALFLLLLVAFSRLFVGTLQTEHLGLALGALGFALLMGGAELEQPSFFLVGCFATALALSARAGAFFLLPVLALWGARNFRRKALLSLPVLASAVGIMALAVGSSLGLSAVLGRADAAFSNFSYVLYGLLTGGDWRSALQDHPELLSSDPGELPARIYALAGDVLKKDPWSLGRGALRAWGAFLGPYPFGFVGRPGSILLMLMALAGLVRAGRRGSATDSLVTAMALGVLLSVPFVPPWDADAMRAYAVTVPLIAALPARCLATTRMPAAGDAARRSQLQWAVAGVAITVAATLLPPLLGRRLGAMPAHTKRLPNCEAGVDVRVTPGSYVDVVEQSSSAGSRFTLRAADFRSGLEKLAYPSLREELAGLHPPFRLLSAPGIGPKGLTEFLVITTPTMAPADGRLRTQCAKLSASPEVRAYSLAYAQGEKSARAEALP